MLAIHTFFYYIHLFINHVTRMILLYVWQEEHFLLNLGEDNDELLLETLFKYSVSECFLSGAFVLFSL